MPEIVGREARGRSLLWHVFGPARVSYVPEAVNIGSQRRTCLGCCVGDRGASARLAANPGSIYARALRLVRF